MTAAVNLAHVNGVDIEYVEQGEGLPLVFVHGYISDHRVWDDQIRLFSRHHKVIAPSQRYFGTRQWRDRGERFSPSTHVDDLAALIRKLGVAPAHIVGWSYGAALALALAVRHPDCVGSLFAYEPGVTTFVEDPEEVRIVTEDRHDMVGAALALKSRGDSAGAVGAVFDHANGSTGLFEALSDTARSIFLDNARTVPLMFGAAEPLSINRADLAHIKVPVVMARGGLTRPLYRIATDVAHGCIPASRLAVIPDAMHASPVLTPTRFNQALLDHLSALAVA
ncbi:alpha/beta hydrolase (plasmid) [Ralstonia solanacearum]|nr:hydrolase [Ralstonia solanacearum FJAT-1458]QKL74609.1 alpha/beta hydrolase [Ralstonia solanacearum]QKL79811.1 alpha/beta hydrolase [Ralstonia solanacearum]QKL85018.1 alpha/beta hydrolase [Ralstonia solanacearum]QKL90235.1 alpha/beta hydrolase [Ralstonia solanacearum]